VDQVIRSEDSKDLGLQQAYALVAAS
jgi:hypothetical protein